MSRLPSWLAWLQPERTARRRDAVAGVPCAISSVADGMASDVLVGVSPVYCLNRFTAVGG